MSTVRVNIEPTVLDDAVKKSGRSFDEVKRRYTSFEKWINEELSPTYNQLVELSKYLRVPFGYLLVKTPVVEELPLLDFRTIDTESILHPTRELVDTIHDMERKQDWLRNRLIEERSEPLPYVGVFNEDANYLDIADKIRETFSLSKDWYKAATSRIPTFNILRNIFSQYGITVMQNGTALNNTHRTLDLDEFRAFTLVDEYVPLIFINSLDSNNGKTFSLLHEVAHIFLGVDSLYNNDFQRREKHTNTIEVLCNKVAGELIAPTDIFLNLWNSVYKDEQDLHSKITEISNVFKVSKLVVARKALDQKYIDAKQYDEIAELVQEEFILSRERKRNPGGHPVNNALSRLDENFMRTLVESTEFGETPYSEAYRLAGISRGVFEDVTERLKGVR